MKSNPNAAVATGTGGVGVLVVWLLGHFGVAVSAEVGAALATGVAAAALFVGRNGIKGTLSRIWRGK